MNIIYLGQLQCNGWAVVDGHSFPLRWAFDWWINLKAATHILLSQSPIYNRHKIILRKWNDYPTERHCLGMDTLPDVNWFCIRVSEDVIIGQEQQWWQQQQQQQGKPHEASSSSLYAVYPCRYLTTSLRISLDCTLDLAMLSYGPQNKTIVLPQSDTFSCVFRLSLWLSALQASLCHDCRPLRAPAEVSWPLFDISPLGLFVVLTLCACTQASSIVNSTSYLFIILFIHSSVWLS